MNSLLQLTPHFFHCFNLLHYFPHSLHFLLRAYWREKNPPLASYQASCLATLNAAGEYCSGYRLEFPWASSKNFTSRNLETAEPPQLNYSSFLQNFIVLFGSDSDRGGQEAFHLLAIRWFHFPYFLPYYCVLSLRVRAQIAMHSFFLFLADFAVMELLLLQVLLLILYV